METKKGKLTIFFGYCAGVGKTYAMLNAAQQKSVEGIDTVIGYIEPHDRKETTDLMYGLEMIDKKKIQYKNHLFYEFDLQAALQRKPQLILVDELAHTNAPGSLHLKRYSDVEELLRAGIDVYTTVNVQHLESLHDVVYSITQVNVNERIPDRIFDMADDVKLVDIEVDDLINRLKQGKIYPSQRIHTALHHFFLKDNLKALREIALRRCADRINLTTNQQNKPYISEHVLVCLGSSPTNQKVIRTASKLAQAFHCELTALYVQTSHSNESNPKYLHQLNENLLLARHLNANIVSTYGEDVAYQVSEYAKAEGISKLVIGRSLQKKGWLGKQTIVDKITQLNPNLDIYIIPDAKSSYQRKKITMNQYMQFDIKDVFLCLCILAISIILSLFIYPFYQDVTSVVLIFILAGCMMASLASSPLLSIAFCFISVLVINYLFMVPKYSLLIASTKNIVTLFVMIGVSMSINLFQLKLKKEKDLACFHARSNHSLLTVSQRFLNATTYEEVKQETCVHLYKLLNRVLIFYPVMDKRLQSPFVYNPNNVADIATIYLNDFEQSVANWVMVNNKNAGASTSTLSSANGYYLAIRRNNKVFAVIGIGYDSKQELDQSTLMLLKTILNESALAFDAIENK